MPRFEKSSVIKVPIAQLFEFFLDLSNLSKISPPEITIIDLNATVPVVASSHFTVKAKLGFLRIDWEGRVVQIEPPKLLVDEQVRGPFRKFVHTHHFRDLGGHTLLIEEIDYKPPLGPLGALADRFFIRRLLQRMFDHRHQKLKELFETREHSRVESAPHRG